MTTFDPTKPVQTREGKPARILATDVANPRFPIVAAIRTNIDGDELVYSYTDDGRLSGFPHAHPFNLVNVPERTKRYVNVYPNGMGSFWATLQDARRSTHDTPTLELTYEDGVCVDARIIAP